MITLVVVMSGVYGSTLLPGIHSWGDITKWQFLGKVLGIPHPTGYPIYLLLTHLLSCIPIGSLALRINAFSMVCAVLTLVGLYLILRQLRQPPWFAAVSAFAFGCSSTLWGQAVVAEVYALNAAFVSWTILYFIRWQQSRRNGHLLVACLLYALSFCNHLTVVCLLPAVIFIVVVTQPSAFVRPRIFLPIVGFILLGVGLYGYLFVATWTGGPHLEYRITDLDSFIKYVTGGPYRHSMFASSWTQFYDTRLPDFADRLWNEYNAAVFLALPGLFCLRSSRVALFLLLALAGYSVFVANYAIHDIQVYFIPIFLLLSILIAAAIWRPFADARRFRVPLALGKYLLAIAAAALLLSANYGKHDESDNDRSGQRVKAMLNHVGSDALIVLDGWVADYGVFEAILYSIYGDETYAGKNIYVATELNPHKIREYMDGRATISSPVMATDVPPGLQVYTVSRYVIRHAADARMRVVPAVHRLKKLVPTPGVEALDIRIEDMLEVAGQRPVRQLRLRGWDVAWYGDDQIFCPCNRGDHFSIRVRASGSGSFKAIFLFTSAGNYGVVDVDLDGERVLTGVDLFSKGIGVRHRPVILENLSAGEHVVTVTVSSKNANSHGFHVGIDAIELERLHR
jgi:hypothetical protein